jgi:hypothetical protein
MIVAHTYTHLMLIALTCYRWSEDKGLRTSLALLKAGIGRDHGDYAYICSSSPRYLVLLYSVVK